MAYSVDVEQFLTSPLLDEGAKETDLASRSYAMHAMARMDGRAIGSGSDVFSPQGETTGAVVLESAIGSLVQRQATYGPLLRYPRVVIVGPRASFAFMEGSAQTPLWSSTVISDGTGSSLHKRNIDKLIWVKLVPKATGSASARTPPTLVITIASMQQDSRTGADIPTSLLVENFRFGPAGPRTGSTENQIEQAKREFEALQKNLGLDTVREGETYKYDVVSSTVLENNEEVSDIAFIKRGLQSLDWNMRSTERSQDTMYTDVEMLYKAVLAGFVPYPEADLVRMAEGSSMPKPPAPYPGEANIPDILQVMRSLYRYSSETTPALSGGVALAKRAGSARNPYADLSDADESVANPYDWLTEFSVDDFIASSNERN